MKYGNGTLLYEGFLFWVVGFADGGMEGSGQNTTVKEQG